LWKKGGDWWFSEMIEKAKDKVKDRKYFNEIEIA